MLALTNIVLGWKGSHLEKLLSSVGTVSGKRPIIVLAYPAWTSHHLSIINCMWHYMGDGILTALDMSQGDNYFSEERENHSSMILCIPQNIGGKTDFWDWIWLRKISINIITYKRGIHSFESTLIDTNSINKKYKSSPTTTEQIFQSLRYPHQFYMIAPYKWMSFRLVGEITKRI